MEYKFKQVATIDDIPTKVSELINDEAFITIEQVPTKTSELVNDAGFAEKSEIPTTTTDLINNSGFITENEIPKKVSAFENDSHYAKEEDIPSKTSELVNDSDFATVDKIPKKLSDLTNDKGFITKTAIPTKMSELTNDADYVIKNEIPTKVSQLTNDAGYLTAKDIHDLPTTPSQPTNRDINLTKLLKKAVISENGIDGLYFNTKISQEDMRKYIAGYDENAVLAVIFSGASLNSPDVDIKGSFNLKTETDQISKKAITSLYYNDNELNSTLLWTSDKRISHAIKLGDKIDDYSLNWNFQGENFYNMLNELDYIQQEFIIEGDEDIIFDAHEFFGWTTQDGYNCGLYALKSDDQIFLMTMFSDKINTVSDTDFICIATQEETVWKIPAWYLPEEKTSGSQSNALNYIVINYIDNQQDKWCKLLCKNTIFELYDIDEGWRNDYFNEEGKFLLSSEWNGYTVELIQPNNKIPSSVIEAVNPIQVGDKVGTFYFNTNSNITEEMLQPYLTEENYNDGMYIIPLITGTWAEMENSPIIAIIYIKDGTDFVGIPGPFNYMMCTPTESIIYSSEEINDSYTHFDKGWNISECALNIDPESEIDISAFTSTDQYVGYIAMATIQDSYFYLQFVTEENKDSLGIIPGETQCWVPNDNFRVVVTDIIPDLTSQFISKDQEWTTPLPISGKAPQHKTTWIGFSKFDDYTSEIIEDYQDYTENKIGDLEVHEYYKIGDKLKTIVLNPNAIMRANQNLNAATNNNVDWLKQFNKVPRVLDQTIDNNSKTYPNSYTMNWMIPLVTKEKPINSAKVFSAGLYMMSSENKNGLLADIPIYSLMVLPENSKFNHKFELEEATNGITIFSSLSGYIVPNDNLNSWIINLSDCNNTNLSFKIGYINQEAIDILFSNDILLAPNVVTRKIKVAEKIKYMEDVFANNQCIVPPISTGAEPMVRNVYNIYIGSKDMNKLTHKVARTKPSSIPVVQVYDENYKMILVDVSLTDEEIVITFGEKQSTSGINYKVVVIE